MKYVCDICGYVYDPEVGDPDNGVAPGTPWGRSSRRLGLPALRRRQGPVQPGRIKETGAEKEDSFSALCSDPHTARTKIVVQPAHLHGAANVW